MEVFSGCGLKGLTMETAGNNVLEKIVKYQTYLEKCLNRTGVPEKDLMIVLCKLNGLDITLEHLQVTGVGKTVNSYRKNSYEDVAVYARTLVSKWKQLAEAAALEISRSNTVPGGNSAAINKQLENNCSNAGKYDSLSNEHERKVRSGVNYDDKKADIANIHGQEVATNTSVVLKTVSSDKNRLCSSAFASHSSEKSSSKHRSSSSHSSHSRSKTTSEHSRSAINLVDRSSVANHQNASTSHSSGTNRHLTSSRSSRTNEHSTTAASQSSRTSKQHASASALRSSPSIELGTSLGSHSSRSSSPNTASSNKSSTMNNCFDESVSPERIASSSSSASAKILNKHSTSASKSSVEKKSSKAVVNNHTTSKIGRQSEIDADQYASSQDKSSSSSGWSKHSHGDNNEESRKEKRARFETADSDLEADGDNPVMSFEEMLNYDAGRSVSSKRKAVVAKNVNSSADRDRSDKSSSKNRENGAKKCNSSKEAHGTSEKVNQNNKELYSDGDYRSSKKSDHLNMFHAMTDKSSGVNIPPPVRMIDISAEDILETVHDVADFGSIKSEFPKPTDNGDSGDMDWIGQAKRNFRTNVYSGKKHNYLTEVPTLYQSCIRVLMDNVSALEYVGPIPYDILKPVLERCTSQQLYYLEDLNPQFVGETDELWEMHCRKEFKGREPAEFDSWRELYLTLHDEREQRLKRITASISQTQTAKLATVQSTKLAYVDTVAKAPREVRRNQLKYGTAKSSSSSAPSSSNTPRSRLPHEPRVSVKQQLASNIHHVAPIGGEAKSKASVKLVAPMMDKVRRQMKSYRR